jgi:pyruvate dehydrogenase E2 component (dihydrolipoamide acetyltransferase)
VPNYKHFPLPDVGEGLVEAEILTWHVQPGQQVKVNEIFVEIETSKAAVELPAPYEGVVTELLAEPGQTVAVGTPIIIFDIDPSGAAPEPSTSDNGSAGTKIGEESASGRIQSLVGYGPKTGAAKRRTRKVSTPEPTPEPVAVAPEPEPVVVAGGYVPLAKPPVRKLAKDLGVDLRALATEGQVITRDDVQRAAEPVATPSVSTVDTGERERRVQVRGVRKATAKAMVDSAFTAPHVTEFLTIDVTPMTELRTKLKNHPEFRDVKLTPLVFAAKAVCLAVRRTPDINAVWDGETGEIVYKSYVHLGIAAATPRGLVVPKVHDADAMSLRELAQALDALALKARDGKTTPAEMANGTFTITNVGVFGVDTGTPIINPGESAILALGAIRDTPWVVDGQIVPRKVCQLSLSFDHRVIDGQQGSEFLADVGALLADPSIAITY